MVMLQIDMTRYRSSNLPRKARARSANPSYVANMDNQLGTTVLSIRQGYNSLERLERDPLAGNSARGGEPINGSEL